MVFGPTGTLEVDLRDAPRGVRYCIPSTPSLPFGYMTANCTTDGDCPDRSVCMDRHCRAVCVDDRACAAPTRCLGGTVRFCYCADCEGEEEEEEKDEGNDRESLRRR